MHSRVVNYTVLSQFIVEESTILSYCVITWCVVPFIIDVNKIAVLNVM